MLNLSEVSGVDNGKVRCNFYRKLYDGGKRDVLIIKGKLFVCFSYIAQVSQDYIVADCSRLA